MRIVRFAQAGAPARIRRRVGAGYTLIELMIVLVVIAILAAVAVPAYQSQAFRARRSDGKDLLLRVALAEERHYTSFHRYADTLADLGLGSGDSERGYYTISVATARSAQAYILSAMPQGVQAGDACAALTLDHTGVKGESGGTGNGDCW